MNGLLEKELKKQRIQARIEYHYLDTERKDFEQRKESYRTLLDSLSGNKPEVILINDDYALSFYLLCGHPLVSEIPAVFTGVYQPRWDLLKDFPNVTGKWDHLDYLANVRFIEKLFKKHVAITVYNEWTFMSKYAYKEIHEQLEGVKGIRFNHYYLYEMYSDSLDIPADKELFKTLQEWGRNDAPYPYSVLTFRPYRNIKGVAVVGQSGDIFTQEYYLNDLYGIITVPLGLSHISPTFTVINEPFGFWNAYLGGYFTSCEQQMSEGAALMRRILDGTPPEAIPITESAKEYVVDWHALERFKLDKGIFPSEVRFMNMPFYERYKPWLIFAGIILSLSIIVLLSYVIYLYLREQKRTINALYLMRQKNTSLNLAIEGGGTYVWEFKEGEFWFEHALGNLPQRISMEAFTKFIHPDDLSSFKEQEKSLWKAEKEIMQYRCKFTSFEYEWWEFRFSVLSTGVEKEEQKAVSGLLINIQAMKNKEEELIVAKTLAQSFLANMSHEIRTPLNAIVGFSNLLISENDFEESEKHEFIETINRNCDLLLVLINDVLEISRLDSGQMKFTMEECSINELADNLYLTHQLLIPKQLRFLKEVPESVSVVYTDKRRLSQVVTNFLTNACKFTKTGYIKLGFEYLAESNEVAIFVEDSGKGISKEQQKRIFSRFYKQNEFSQGTGLGLAICSGIIENLGGRIKLRSKLGEGSRFTVILPCM